MAADPKPTRRRPVPFEFKDIDHALSVRSRVWGRGFRRVGRAKGYCRCGALFPRGEHVDNLDAPAVREAWKDHVERVFYNEADERDERPEWRKKYER